MSVCGCVARSDVRWICQGLGIRVIRERLFRAMNIYK